MVYFVSLLPSSCSSCGCVRQVDQEPAEPPGAAVFDPLLSGSQHPGLEQGEYCPPEEESLHGLILLTMYSAHPHLQVDCLKQKSVLLELTAALTEGVVNGKKLNIKQATHLGTPCPSPATRDPNTHSVRNPQRIGWPYFREIFMLSALNNKDVNTLKVS